jgi:hypothetical protein
MPYFIIVIARRHDIFCLPLSGFSGIVGGNRQKKDGLAPVLFVALN